LTPFLDGCNEQKPPAMAAEIVRRAFAGRMSLGRVLDVGCGIGSILLAARPGARSLAGVDIRQGFLDKAVVKLPDATLSRDSADALPFADGTFDTVFFCDVIEHLENPFTSLREIRRVLAPGAILVVTTPNSNALLRYVLQDKWPAMRDTSHILYFTRFSLRHALTSVGFVNAGDETLGGSAIPLANAVLERLRNGGTLVCKSTIA
jgi:ubiquinone/menaquinone biosynthesis C-methylase UbiE